MGSGRSPRKMTLNVSFSPFQASLHTLSKQAICSFTDALLTCSIDAFFHIEASAGVRHGRCNISMLRQERLVDCFQIKLAYHRGFPEFKQHSCNVACQIVGDRWTRHAPIQCADSHCPWSSSSLGRCDQDPRKADSEAG